MISGHFLSTHEKKKREFTFPLLFILWIGQYSTRMTFSSFGIVSVWVSPQWTQ